MPDRTAAAVAGSPGAWASSNHVLGVQPFPVVIETQAKQFMMAGYRGQLWFTGDKNMALRFMDVAAAQTLIRSLPFPMPVRARKVF
jgi:hypothetical protein